MLCSRRPSHPSRPFDDTLLNYSLTPVLKTIARTDSCSQMNRWRVIRIVAFNRYDPVNFLVGCVAVAQQELNFPSTFWNVGRDVPTAVAMKAQGAPGTCSFSSRRPARVLDRPNITPLTSSTQIKTNAKEVAVKRTLAFIGSNSTKRSTR